MNTSCLSVKTYCHCVYTVYSPANCSYLDYLQVSRNLSSCLQCVCGIVDYIDVKTVCRFLVVGSAADDEDIRVIFLANLGALEKFETLILLKLFRSISQP